MGNYEFGAGGFKLGERVEILTTKHRGILIGEMIHLSGCNTYTKELIYGLSYMADGKEVGIDSHSHGLILMSQKIDVRPKPKQKEKVGPLFSDSRLDLISNNSISEYHRFGLDK